MACGVCWNFDGDGLVVVEETGKGGFYRAVGGFLVGGLLWVERRGGVREG